MAFKDELEDVQTELVSISTGAIERTIAAITDGVAKTKSETGLTADEAAKMASRLGLGALQDLAGFYAQTLKAGQAFAKLGNETD